MTEQRPRTMLQKQWSRRRFWMEHGEKFRLALIGGGMIVVVGLLASALLKGG